MRKIFALVIAMACSMAGALQIEGVEYEDIAAYARTYGYSVAGGGQYILLMKDGRSIEFRAGQDGARFQDGRLLVPASSLPKTVTSPAAAPPYAAPAASPAPAPTPTQASADGRFQISTSPKPLTASPMLEAKYRMDTTLTNESAGELCLGLIHDSLKAPATAQYSRPITVTRHPNGWSITGNVDAQNGYGALIRNRYYCDIRLANGYAYIFHDMF